MLLRGRAGQRLEHVGEVGGAVLQRPLLHRLGDRVGERGVERLAALEGRLQLLEDVGGQPFALHRDREDVGAERVVLGQGQVERAEGLSVGAPLRCGHVLLADTGHRLCQFLALVEPIQEPKEPNGSARGDAFVPRYNDRHAALSSRRHRVAQRSGRRKLAMTRSTASWSGWTGVPRRRTASQISAVARIGPPMPSTRNAHLGVDPADHPGEVHPEEAGQEGQRQEDRRDHGQPVDRLVQPQVHQLRHRVGGGVDPVDQPVELLVDALEVALVVGFQPLDLADLLADPLEAPALRAELATHRRQPQADRPQRPHPHPRVAGVAGQDLQPLERQLGVVERVEGGRDHRVEDDVDDVLLAAPLGAVAGQELRQRDALAVDGEQVVAVDEHVDLDRSQARRVLAVVAVLAAPGSSGRGRRRAGRRRGTSATAARRGRS